MLFFCLTRFPALLILFSRKGGTGSEVDSGRILRISFGPGYGHGFNYLRKPDPESLFNFGSSRSLCGHFLSKNMGKLILH